MACPSGPVHIYESWPLEPGEVGRWQMCLLEHEFWNLLIPMVRMAVRCLNRANHHQSSSEIGTMREKLSQITGRNVRLAMLL
jgi:hypothetical protein